MLVIKVLYFLFLRSNVMWWIYVSPIPDNPTQI